MSIGAGRAKGLARIFEQAALERTAGGSWRRSICRLGPAHDLIAERVEAADQALGRAVLVHAHGSASGQLAMRMSKRMMRHRRQRKAGEP
jgi:hypothetical protein